MIVIIIIKITAATTTTTKMIIIIILIIIRRIRIFRIIIRRRRRKRRIRDNRLHDRSKLTQICAKLIFKRFVSFLLNGNLLLDLLLDLLKFTYLIYCKYLLPTNWVAPCLLLLVISI